METNKAEEYACKKYNVKDGLNDYDENYFNSTNVNLAKAFIEGAEYRQSEIDELTKEVERLRKEREWISIESCLPNYYDLCLLMNNESKDQEDNWVVAGYYNHKEEKFYNQFQDKDSDCEIFPTHWQPLPPINQ